MTVNIKIETPSGSKEVTFHHTHKQLKNVNQLRILHFLTSQTTAVNHNLHYKPRWINQLYAFITRLLPNL